MMGVFSNPDVIMTEILGLYVMVVTVDLLPIILTENLDIEG